MNKQLETVTERLKGISSTNKAIDYMIKRVAHNHYRGNALGPQHNNLDLESLHKLAKVVYKYTKKNSLAIPVGDDKGNPFPKRYENFYDEICKIQNYTDNTFRKNFIPTLIRGDLLKRETRGKKKLIKISPFGEKFASSEKLIEKNELFSKFLLGLFPNFIETVFKVLKEDNGINKITFIEFMFFIRGMNNEEYQDLRLSYDEGVNLIKAYNKIAPVRRKSIENILSDELDVKKFIGFKKGQGKKDWDNWVNYINQHFLLFEDSTFVVNRGKSRLEHSISLNPSGDKKIHFVKNKNKVKEDWTKKHEIEPKPGYQYDHIIATRWGITRSLEFQKALENWQNIWLLRNDKHDIKNRKQDQYMEIKIINDKKIELQFLDGSKSLTLKIGKHVLINNKHIEKMIDYNKELLSAY